MQTARYLPEIAVPSPSDIADQLPGRDIKWVLRALHRHAWTLCLLSLSCGLVLSYLIVQLPARYTAFSTVLLDNRDKRPVDIEAVTPNAFSDLEGINSQIEVLYSDMFSERVVRDLELDKDPEFNPELSSGTGLRAEYQWLRARLGALLAGRGGDKAATKELSVHTKILDNYYKALRVELKRDTRVIYIHFTSSDPEKAARIADHIAYTFIRTQSDDAEAATQRANQWLGRQIAELKQRVGAQEQAIEEFRRRTGLLAGKDDKILSERISELTAQLVTASAERAQPEARLAQVRRLLREKGSAEAMQDVLRSPVIQNLAEEEVAVTRRLGELGQELGNTHPRLLAARAELVEIQRKIAQEVNKVVQSLESEAAIASAREASIQKKLNELEARLGDANQAEVKLRAMTRQFDADQQLLQAFLKRQQETNAQLDAVISSTNARLVSPATLPVKPSGPPRAVLILASFLLPLLLGSLVVLWLEYLDPRLRSNEQLERALGMRGLALIPMIRQRGVTPALYTQRNPNSIYAEALRLILYSIFYGGSGTPARCVLITSSQPEEGKGATATSLGVLAALMGKRAVVVDFDVRHPSVHEALGTAEGPGLAAVLRGACCLSEALLPTQAGVSVLPVGPLNAEAPGPLPPARARNILAELVASFDLVIVKGPPVIPVSETRVLGQLVDAVVLLGRWGKVHPAAMTLALRALTDSGARVLGAALTMVEVEKQARYGFADAPYYAKPARKYYLTRAAAALPAARQPAAHSKRSWRVAFAAAAAVLLVAGAATAVGGHLLRPPSAASRTVGASEAVTTPPQPDAEPTSGPQADAPAEAVPADAGEKVSAAGRSASVTAAAASPAAPVLQRPSQPEISAMGADEKPGATAGIDEAAIARILARGDEMLASSDVNSARLFYGHAADRGSAAGLTAMAGTYDPLILASRKVKGVLPKPREAIFWYRRAIAAGDPAAEGRLRALVEQMQRSGLLDVTEATALLRTTE